MQAFEWANAKSVENATALLNDVGSAKPPGPDAWPHPIGGGQDLHTTMKAYIITPPRVVNLKTIPDANRITYDPKGILTIGATATLTQIAEHPDVKELLPGLVEAVESVATPQIRNMGTIGGNLCQRPRCWYFRLENVKCLKRGGDTCYAKEGENKYNAAWGTDAPCVITQPSDPATMLVAKNARILVAGPEGKSEAWPASKFFRMPTVDDPYRETILKPGQIVTGVRFHNVFRGPKDHRSTYLKFKERSSLDFAMASVAVAKHYGEDDAAGTWRVVLGGVAPIPWEVREIERFLSGKQLDESTIAKAAELAVADARPLSQNAYKVQLIRTLVKRALMKLA